MKITATETTDAFGGKIIQKTLTNDSGKDEFVGDVPLFEINSLESVGLSSKNCRLFRSGRHKNDMPSVCTFGKFDGAMTDCTAAVKESGSGIDKNTSNVIISDHFTVIGNTENYLCLEFITGNSQLFRTEIYTDEVGNFTGLKAFVEFNCFLRPNEERKTEALRLVYTNNVEKEIDTWAKNKAEGKPLRTKKAPAVFCTWYYYGRDVSYNDVLVNLDKIKEKALPFDVFQIDDGWQKRLGDWEPNEKFPNSMKNVADTIKSYGLSPGIWTSPFVAHPESLLWKEHPDWILRDKNDLPVLFPMNEDFYYIVDISLEKTWEYFESFYKKLTLDWGFSYHKLDFTRAPIAAKNACFKNPYLTPAESYRNAVKAIRRGMGESAFFLMCGGLYDPLIGIVDAQRSGSDVLSMWSSNINKNGKTAPYTIKQSFLRYYMNNWWYNDPDALMIRKNDTPVNGSRLTYGLLNDEEVKTCVLNQLCGGGLFCTTEPLDKMDETRLLNLKHLLPIKSVKTEPVDLMNISRYPDKMRLKEKNNTDSVYLVIINFDDFNALTQKITLKEIAGDFLELSPGTEYSVCDFYAKTVYKKLNSDSAVELKPICPHGATIIKLTQNKNMVDNPDFSGHFLL